MNKVCNHVRFYNREMIRHLSGENLRPPESWKPVVKSIHDFQECSLFEISELLNEHEHLCSGKLSDLEVRRTEENINRIYKTILFEVSYFLKLKNTIPEELIKAVQILFSFYYFSSSLIDDDTVKNFLSTVRDKNLILD